jgi:hypothetical protein
MSATLNLLHTVLLHMAKPFTLHVMCNAKKAIHALGGPSAVAKAHGLTVQRVCNWGARGIPDAILLDHPLLADQLRAAGYVRPAKSAQAIVDHDMIAA